MTMFGISYIALGILMLIGAWYSRRSLTVFAIMTIFASYCFIRATVIL